MSWEGVLQAFDAQMEEPEMFGWFHITFLFLAFAAAGILCLFYKNTSQNQVRKVVFCVAIVVIVLEIYKQINYSFTYGEGNIVFRYQWCAFPWQFCSMPMYVGFLAGVFKKGKVHDSLCAFLATYAVFAGLCDVLSGNCVCRDHRHQHPDNDMPWLNDYCGDLSAVYRACETGA